VVIPIHDRNPVRRTPVVTYVLIAVNVVVFLLQPIAFSSVGGGVDNAQACRQEAFFQRWGAIPDELLSNDPADLVVVAPAGNGQCLLGTPAYDKQPFVSAITAMFLHGGWLHLLGNLLFLFVFGNNVEDRLGRLRYLLCYLGWGVVATYGFALTQASSQSVVVGASGAIAGVLGAYLVLFPKARVISLVPFLFFLPVPLPAWVVLGVWFGLQALYSAGASVTEGAAVAYVAHVAGFVAGFLTAKMIGRRA
jgi:membrane associated rhomboid family serine protease